MSAAEQMLAGQVVVVTGGGSPFGRALAQRFTQAGAHVVLADLDHAFTRGLAEGLQRDGLTVSFAPLDVRKPHDCFQVAEQIVAAHGRMDVWINGQGYTDSVYAPTGPSESLGLEDWDESLSVTLSGAFFAARAAAAHMLAQGRGLIVNLGTVDAYQAGAGRAALSAAQGGLVALTRALGVEWAPRGVRVVGVAANWPPSRDPAAPVYAERRLPLGAPATADDVAEAVLFLASAEAGFITAETLRVDAGWTAYHLF